MIWSMFVEVNLKFMQEKITLFIYSLYLVLPAEFNYFFPSSCINYVCVKACATYYLCVCVCVCVCLFPLTAKASPDWTKWSIFQRYVSDGILREYLCQKPLSHVIDNHNSSLQASNCARECQLNRVEPREVKDNSYKLSVKLSSLAHLGETFWWISPLTTTR